MRDWPGRLLDGWGFRNRNRSLPLPRYSVGPQVAVRVGIAEPDVPAHRAEIRNQGRKQKPTIYSNLNENFELCIARISQLNNSEIADM